MEMDGTRKQPRRRLSLLTGSGLFFGLVAYLNLRSPEPPQGVDWVVLSAGFALFAYAVVRWSWRHSDPQI